MPMQKHQLDGPIPGENFTSDTKNYPWHRPPEFTELDEAIDYVSKVMTNDSGSEAIISMLEMGMSVVMVSDIVITKGISTGKWTPDLGLILAGPVAHIIVIMAREYGIDYDLGVETRKSTPTSAFFREAKKIDKKKAAEAGEAGAEVGETLSKASGFMSEPNLGSALSEAQEFPQGSAEV